MARTEIRELEPGDLPDLVRFYASQSDADHSERGDAVAHMRWYLFENPARATGIPAGFLGRDAEGRVAGALLCSPQRFRSGASEHLVCISGGYYVDAAYRGLGLLLLRRLLAVKGFAHVSTTMNHASGGIYERNGGYPIARTDRELLGVLRWPPLVEEVLLRRKLAPGLARAASKLAALRPRAIRRGDRSRLRRVASPDEIEADALLPLPELDAQLAAVRSPEFLRWRYFEGGDATRDLFVYRGERGRALVGAYRRWRGTASQMRTLGVLDLWGSLPPAETPALLEALADWYAGEVDAIAVRGLLPEREAAARAAGFVSRDLPRATGVCIDPAGSLPTRDWYLVPADGDSGH
ncbi:MAG TPA: hypothetical protein VNF72_10095 [Myxococcota bacterium]|nr:hypothetical protein [Myxococcota bacterium]